MSQQYDRFPSVPRDQLSPAQQNDYDWMDDILEKYFKDVFISKKPDGTFIGPYAALLATPGLMKPFFEVPLAAAKIPGLSTQARETAIMVVAAEYRCGYPLYSHGRIAKGSTSLTKSQIESLEKGIKPEGENALDEDCDLAFDVAKEFCAVKGPLKQAMFDRAVKILGKDGTAALIHYIGSYTYVCIFMNAFNVSVPE